MDGSGLKTSFAIERLTEEIKSFAMNEGADLVGIASVERREYTPKNYVHRNYF